MDVVLIILGILGSGAIVVSVYVFTATARNYASRGNNRALADSARSGLQHKVVRSTTDRRERKPVTFPLDVNGILIANDRRMLTDRRSAA